MGVFMNKRAGCLHIFRQYGFAAAKSSLHLDFPKCRLLFLPFKISRGYRRTAAQQGNQVRQTLLHFAAVDNLVNRTFFQQKFRALEAFGQGFAHRLLNHARAGKADERIRFGQHHVAQKSETGRPRPPGSGGSARK